MQLLLEKFMNRTNCKKCSLKAELEEINIRISEIDDAKAMFKQVVVIEGTDPITQRVSAEKFIKYMKDWIKSAQFTIDKMRLRCSTSNVKLHRVSTLLLQKEEAGENVHVVDFEKIAIENEHLLQKIEQKNTHLIELKRMSGNANLVLTTYKNFLQQQVDELNELKKTIKVCQNKTNLLDSESERAENQVTAEMKLLENLKELIGNYRVPEVMEYVNLKSEVHNLKKTLKVWKRKMNILLITLSTCKAKLEKLIGIENAKTVVRKRARKEQLKVEDYAMEWYYKERDEMVEAQKLFVDNCSEFDWSD